MQLRRPTTSQMAAISCQAFAGNPLSSYTCEVTADSLTYLFSPGINFTPAARLVINSTDGLGQWIRRLSSYSVDLRDDLRALDVRLCSPGETTVRVRENGGRYVLDAASTTPDSGDAVLASTDVSLQWFLL